MHLSVHSHVCGSCSSNGFSSWVAKFVSFRVARMVTSTHESWILRNRRGSCLFVGFWVFLHKKLELKSDITCIKHSAGSGGSA